MVKLTPDTPLQLFFLLGTLGKGLSFSMASPRKNKAAIHEECAHEANARTKGEVQHHCVNPGNNTLFMFFL